MVRQSICHQKFTKGSLFIFLIFTSFFAANAQEQDSIPVFDRKYSFNLENTSLYHALFQISNKIGYDFSYNSDILDGEGKVNQQFKNQPLETILKAILKDTTLGFETLNEHIIIFQNHGKKIPGELKQLEEPPSPKVYSIRGKILDERKNKPIPYCNIGLLNRPTGTVSNMDGEFLLKISREALDDTVVISYIGYKNMEIPVRELQDRNTPIVLDHKSYSIQEVIVRWTDPYKVVTEAMGKMRENYFREPVLLTSFYRETIKREDEYTTISEAVMKIYKAYSKVFKGDQIKVLKSRKRMNYSEQDNVLVKLKSGLEAVLLLDIIDQNINFLHPLHLENYEYYFNGITYYNNHDTYEIKFTPNKEVDFPLYSGTIYIDVKTLAIVATEFYLNDQNLYKIANSLIIKKKWDLKVKPKQAKYTVNYRQLNGKFFLNHIRGELIFKVRKKNELLGENYTVSFEMITSEIDTSNVQNFDYREITKPQKIFVEEIKGYDPSFWGQYNYILPDEPITKTLDKMNAQIKMLQEEPEK